MRPLSCRRGSDRVRDNTHGVDRATKPDPPVALDDHIELEMTDIRPSRPPPSDIARGHGVARRLEKELPTRPPAYDTSARGIARKRDVGNVTAVRRKRGLGHGES